MKRAVIAVVLAALATPAPAYFDTGNDWLETCRRRDGFGEGLCLGLTSSTVDTMLALGYKCQNITGVTRRQAMDTIIQYLHSNPAQRHLPGVFSGILAIEKAFGCKN